MSTTFDSYNIELNLPTNVDGEVECHDYTVTYDDNTDYITFTAVEYATGKKYIWQCDCDFYELTNEDYKAMLSNRGIDTDVEPTLEDWWLSNIKMRYVGCLEKKK